MDQLSRRAAITMLCIMVPSLIGLTWLLFPYPPARILSLFTPHPAALPAWIAAAVITAAYIAASARSLPYIGAHFLHITALKCLAIPFAIITGAFEELFFRQILMNVLAKSGHAPALQVAASALTFGAAHAIWGLFAKSWQAVLIPMLWTTALGASLACTYLLGGRDVAPCIWSHTIINLCLEPWLLLAVMRRAAEARSNR
jgi:hypothetical protein